MNREGNTVLPVNNSIIINVLGFFVSQILTFGYFRKPTPAFELLRVREPPAGIFGSRKCWPDWLTDRG